MDKVHTFDAQLTNEISKSIERERECKRLFLLNLKTKIRITTWDWYMQVMAMLELLDLSKWRKRFKFDIFFAKKEIHRTRKIVTEFCISEFCT